MKRRDILSGLLWLPAVALLRPFKKVDAVDLAQSSNPLPTVRSNHGLGADPFIGAKPIVNPKPSVSYEAGASNKIVLNPTSENVRLEIRNPDKDWISSTASTIKSNHGEDGDSQNEGGYVNCEWEMYHFYIAGVQHYDLYCPGRQMDLKIGDKISLKREPKNEHDERAIALYLNNGDQVGYVPKWVNHIPSHLMDTGADLFCRVVKINPDDDPWHMIKVTIVLASNSEQKTQTQMNNAIRKPVQVSEPGFAGKAA